jgi:chromosome segregation ATPase
MKRIIGVAAILLIWVGSANCGELKVKVPVDEFEQMKSRLETLEKRNRELKNEVEIRSNKTADAEMEEQLEKMARENEELKSQMNNLSNTTTDTGMNERLETLARENKELQQKVDSLAEQSPEEDSYARKRASQLDALGRENRRLKRAVTSLKESGTVLGSDRRTARQVYFEANKKFATHIYK